MSKDPIRAILLEELETVTQAIFQGEDLGHWLQRLRDVNRALQSLETIIPVTDQERATLRMILEFHDGEDDAPFDVRTHASLLAKVKSTRRG